MDIDRMRSDWMQENDFCKDFSPIFISHVQRTFRESFVLLCGSLSSTQYNTHEKKLEEQN